MNYTTLGTGDEATWGPCTGHHMDPRTIEEDQSLIALKLGDATVDVVYELAGDEAIIDGCFIGKDFVDADLFSQWQRDDWKSSIEKEERK